MVPEPFAKVCTVWADRMRWNYKYKGVLDQLIPYEVSWYTIATHSQTFTLKLRFERMSAYTWIDVSRYFCQGLFQITDLCYKNLTYIKKNLAREDTRLPFLLNDEMNFLLPNDSKFTGLQDISIISVYFSTTIVKYVFCLVASFRLWQNEHFVTKLFHIKWSTLSS